MRNKSRLYILSLFALFIASCFGVDRALTPVAEAGTETTGDGTQLAPIELPAGYGADGGWIQIYFTNPQSPLASQKTGGIDGPLADAIDSAKLSVDVAIYSLSLNSVRDALLRAHDRGARVRLVMESDNLDRADPQKLKDAGIPILGDRREGLMHNKFTIIDGSEVWVGGMNYTDSGAYEDNNVLIRIRSVKMAENYTKEFEEMFVEDRFGDNVLAETPNPRVTIDGTPVDTYFSPDDGAQAILHERRFARARRKASPWRASWTRNRSNRIREPSSTPSARRGWMFTWTATRGRCITRSSSWTKASSSSARTISPTAPNLATTKT
ncbi:MAG: hypothetical protein DPW15_09470 [Chloroflexi bacterium]|nr:hypothetical protein [Chloroflexota bacterium]